MPWTGSRMEDRADFIREWSLRTRTVSELCRRFGISRNTAYKTIKRYCEQSFEGLRDRSRAPRTHPNETPAHVIAAIIECAKCYERWGPRKLRRVLMREHPEQTWPAISTIGDVLRREGMLRRPRKQSELLKITPGFIHPLDVALPNDLWRTDFKGARFSGDKKRCEPLAITDHVSRFGICCELVSSINQHECTRVFQRAFKEYGLPRAILSDNGIPFASTGVAGLTKLSVLWVMLGIRPLRIDKGKPRQNGGHERFNGTLQFEAMTPMAKTKRAQELRCRKFLRAYNEIRPHEALGDRTPSEVFTRSPRSYPARIDEFEYEPSSITVRVDSAGYVRFDARRLYLCEALAKRTVGFERVGDAHWCLHFGPLEIGVYSAITKKLERYDQLVWTADDDDDAAVAQTAAS